MKIIYNLGAENLVSLRFFYFTNSKKTIMKNPKIEVKQNAKGEWYWRQIGRNGKIVCIGGETFKNKPSQKKINKIGLDLARLAHQNQIEFKPRKKK